MFACIANSVRFSYSFIRSITEEPLPLSVRFLFDFGLEPHETQSMNFDAISIMI